MRIKKLLIVGTLALATTGCVSAYTYAATPNDSTESSIDTSKDSAKIKADSESTTEAKENADENTKKDVKSEKNDFEDNEYVCLTFNNELCAISQKQENSNILVTKKVFIS